MRNARTIGAAILGAGLLLGGCGDSPTSPADLQRELTETLATASITFHHSPGDRVDADWQEAFQGWALERLGVRMSALLHYYKYRSRSHLGSVTGRSTNGFAEPAQFRVHSIWPHDGHEALHVYTALLGRPSDFFNEGIAVALNIGPDPQPIDPRWNGRHVHDHVRMMRGSRRYLPLEQILTTDGFRDADDFLTYGEAGSFLYWLNETRGLDPLLRYFRSASRDDSLARIRSDFQATWGLSLQEAERRWLEFLDAG